MQPTIAGNSMTGQRAVTVEGEEFAILGRFTQADGWKGPQAATVVRSASGTFLIVQERKNKVSMYQMSPIKAAAVARARTSRREPVKT